MKTESSAKFGPPKSKRASNYTTLVAELGALYTIHGGLLIVGGVLFGVAVLRAAVWPRWTGIVLIIGVVLALLLNLLRLPDIAQVASSTIRNVALIGMAVAVLRDKHVVR